MAIGSGFRCAIELILLTCLTGPLPTPVKLRSMSSKLLPWISGTQNMMNIRPIRQMPPNIQKVPSVPKTRNKSANVLVTKNVQAQLKAVANEAAVPRILAEIRTWFDRFNYLLNTYRHNYILVLGARVWKKDALAKIW